MPRPERQKLRAVVFIDYQNVYEDFRRAFCSGLLLPTHGQFDPLALAKLLTSREPSWELSETRVYLGRPSPDRDARGAGAHDRQTQLWKDKGVVVKPRPLQYLPGQRPRQKGVDVELAVDVVRMAVQRIYEVGIVVSTDTDLLAAIEAVDLLRGNGQTPRLCVVAYSGLSKALRLPDSSARQPYVINIRKSEWKTIRDGTVYVDARRPEEGDITND